MESSYFTDLDKKPDFSDLKTPLGSLFPVWMKIRDFAVEKYPKAIEEWHVSVKRYGWSFRIKDKRRAIVYLSPQKGHFRLTMVFGQKATDQIIVTDIADAIKKELLNSRVYAEGRVIRLDIYDDKMVEDIKKLIEVKIAN
ncbi:DUF3788 family protein [Maribellus mangrovi]|uniref:DUF3788 family protein n=1 Tax=Maribellus mangrovi TaxID=3133146 RepID=UPI0030EBDAC4